MNPKKIAADLAVEGIKDGMIIGLGTGSTAFWAIQRIAQRVKDGLSIRAVASSKSSEELAAELGIHLVSFDSIDQIDLTIDGADEVDRELNLTKGGGGALLREKILASNSKELVIIVDESKLVERLGAFPLPVEIVQFANHLTLRHLREFGCEVSMRKREGELFVTDNGNFIVDCQFGQIDDPEHLTQQINMIPGVVENGLFTKLTNTVIVGYQDGTTKVLKSL
ncbi:ribose-5-phosphate isomerase RpiA [Paenibacillus sp. N3.4]|uniref:ribose-5-phosphate isomerase RpiA n=1 Tax=Paenibacillus sp. N3.4 TaxID=2603222 RepID=UPI0011C9A930|nr:ribose-5-phosphate isomerase RpiA [Paenibacillus sp. N3.4]TXK76948.1 ribose-5-phosphate isomerase RpiA [Paenibacillus sp. N3.4]